MEYKGTDKWKKRVTELLNQGIAGGISDVQVNGKSVVEGTVANVTVPELPFKIVINSEDGGIDIEYEEE